MNKRIISCTGYGGSGSSAITDLLKEFDSGLSLGDSEFWFLQAYDGISDLEHYLIDGNHRSKVNLAIQNFKNYVVRNQEFYNTFFAEKYIKYSMEYIDSLVDAKFSKAISQYEINNQILRKIIFNYSPFLQKTFSRKKNEFIPYIPKKEKFYSYPGKEKFYYETKKYTTNLFNSISADKKHKFIAVDQLVPSINTQRYFNYIENLKLKNIDRDPRDLYLLNETVWKGAAFVCDTKNINQYISWFKTMRKHRVSEKKSDNILYLKLEQMVYEYEETLKIIYKFLKLDSSSHVFKKKFFNPLESKRNTKLWLKGDNKKYQFELKLIEKELSEYCY